MRRAAQTGLARAEEKLGVVAHLAVPRVELLARVIARQQTIGLNRDPATGCFAKRPAGLAKRGGSRAQAR